MQYRTFSCQKSIYIYIYIYYLCVNSDEIIGVPVAGLNDPCNQLCPPLEKVRVSPHPFLSFFFIFFLFYFFFFKSSFSIDKCRIDVNMRRMSLRSLPYKESICTRNNNILLYGHTNMRARRNESPSNENMPSYQMRHWLIS